MNGRTENDIRLHFTNHILRMWSMRSNSDSPHFTDEFGITYHVNNVSSLEFVIVLPKEMSNLRDHIKRLKNIITVKNAIVETPYLLQYHVNGEKQLSSKTNNGIFFYKNCILHMKKMYTTKYAYQIPSHTQCDDDCIVYEAK